MMNQAPLFDTHLAIEALQDGGFDTKQAKAIVSVVDQSLTGGVATKADLAEVKAELKADIAEVRTELTEVKAELKADIADLKMWVGWGFFIAVGVIGGIIAYATSLILSV
ncbi:MAG: DUF1640 domain-containing protein [Gammaproteobacteria bacterium]|nr:DUF1640 domain-containing protein [Gammaproteobacteria bacterium]